MNSILQVTSDRRRQRRGTDIQFTIDSKHKLINSAFRIF